MMFTQEEGNDLATLEFTDYIIVENIFLTEQINSDLSADVQSLNRRIVKPENYSETAKLAMKPVNKGTQVYEKAFTKDMELNMSGTRIEPGHTYSFKIKPFQQNYTIYTGTFTMGEEGQIIHSEESTTGHWYSNPWVWSSVALIVLVVLLVIKAACY